MSEHYITDEELAEYHAYHTAQDIIDNLQGGIAALWTMSFPEGPCLIAGAMITFDKGLSSFLNRWSEKHPNLFLLSEVTGEFRRYTAEKISFPFICTPHLLAKEMAATKIDVPVTDEMRQLAEEKRYVKTAVENFAQRQLHLGSGYAVLWGYYAYHYIETLLERMKPCKVILWNEFYAFHHIFRGICRERGIPVEYMEFGCMPGTICIEGEGQQGESSVAKNYSDFLKKDVNSREIKQAKHILSFIRETALNRNIQPKVLFEEVRLQNFWPKRKTLLYLGQNDYESGMVPYTDHARRYHSPIFASSLEALEYLELLAIKNKWNLIYKPHPIMNFTGHIVDGNRLHADVVSDVDIHSIIDACDLVITILSQGAYVSLIREKPVLMLGYTQLRGKGCTYEAFSESDIERQIKRALHTGYRRVQKHHFIKHAAQVLKYYLYDDGAERDCRFGMEM